MAKAIFFDFDGVIADSFDLYLQKWQILGKKYKCPILSAESYRGLFEGNFYDRILKRYPELVRRKEIFMESMKMTIEYASMIEIFPGIEEVLAELSKKYKLFLITSTFSLAVERTLSKRHLKKYFKDVYGAEQGLSKEQKFKDAMKKHKLKRQDIIFVTDTLGDLIEAKNQGVPSVAVLWGYHGKKTLQKGKPLKMFAKPEELLKIQNLKI